MVMTTSNFNYGTKELLKNLFIKTKEAYDLWPLQYPSIIEKETTKYETDKFLSYEGTATLPEMTEGADAATTGIEEGYVFTWTQKSYAFDIPVTMKQLKFNQNGKDFASHLAMFLSRAATLRYEYEGASPINNGWTAGVYAGGDGVAYFSNAHPWKTGGTSSNLLTAAVLSKTALKTAIKSMVQATMEYSIPANLQISKIISGTDNVHVLPELLKSEKDPESANNTINVFTAYGLKKVCSNYMSDTNAWLLDSHQPTRKLKESMRPKMIDYDANPSRGLIVGITTMIGAGFYQPMYSFGNAGS